MTLRYYLIGRIVLFIPMILLLLTFVFILLRCLPGGEEGVLFTVLGEMAPPEAYEKLRIELGFNKPIYMQYFDYLNNVFHGNLGRSFMTGNLVTNEILKCFPTTIELTVMSMIIGVSIGIFSGVISADKKNSVTDHSIRLVSLLSYSIPLFWIGMIFQLIFGIQLGILPIYGVVDVGLEPLRITGFRTLDSLLTGNIAAFVSCLKHLLLPSITLGIYLYATICRMTRANMIRTLREDYILTARAKGLPKRVILYKHALRNALLPVITIIGLQFAMLLVGATITEVVFTLPGMGRLLVDAVRGRDFMLVQGVVVWFAIFVGIVSLLIDLINAALDPRIKY